MSPPVRAWLLLIPLTVARSGPAWALDFTLPWIEQPASFEVTLNTLFDYHDDNVNLRSDDDGYFHLRNRLNLKLNSSDFSLFLRLDSGTFFDEPAPEPGRTPYVDRYAPEKFGGSWDGGWLQVDLGDSYTTFGCGLALSVRKSDPLGEDLTLQGVKAQLRMEPVEAVILAGLTNPSNSDLADKTLADPYDLVTGARVLWRALPQLQLAAHGAWFLFDPLERNDQAYLLDDWALVAGGSVEAPDWFDWLHLFAEFDWMGHQGRPLIGQQEGPRTAGWATYASSSFFLGDFSIVAEFKAYEDYYLYTLTSSDDGQHAVTRIDYIRPPTLEPEAMEVHNNWDVIGGRLKVDYRPAGGDTLIFTAYSGFRALDLADAGERWVYNLQAGIEQDFRRTGRARLAIGLREENPLYAGADSHHLLYADALVKLPLSGAHSLDLHGTHWQVHDLHPDNDYNKGEWTLGYTWSPWLGASLIFGYDTSPSHSSELASFFTGEDGRRQRQLFLAGSLSLNLWSRALLRLVAGQMRGGLKCLEGVCRTLPAFAGVRTELTLRF